jgi:hypothetical protein
MTIRLVSYGYLAPEPNDRIFPLRSAISIRRIRQRLCSINGHVCQCESAASQASGTTAAAGFGRLGQSRACEAVVDCTVMPPPGTP